VERRLPIGELAGQNRGEPRRSARLGRHYGLLEPTRSGTAYRLYSATDEQRVQRDAQVSRRGNSRGRGGATRPRGRQLPGAEAAWLPSLSAELGRQGGEEGPGEKSWARPTACSPRSAPEIRRAGRRGTGGSDELARAPGVDGPAKLARVVPTSSHGFAATRVACSIRLEPTSVSDGVEVPLAGRALQGVRAAVGELQPRAHHEVLDRA
jgi:hypothetical protein